MSQNHTTKTASEDPPSKSSAQHREELPPKVGQTQQNGISSSNKINELETDIAPDVKISNIIGKLIIADI